MRRFKNPVVPLLILVCSLPGVHAEALSEVAGRVKSAVQAKQSCWKLNRVQERNEGAAFEQEWLCPKEAVTIYFFQAPSIEAAVKFYEELITSPVEAPGEHVDSPKIGDQSSITTHTDYSRSSYVYFRKGTIVVRIDSNILKLTTPIRTLENAIRFAQIVEEQIEPPGNSPKPTRL